MADKLNWKGLAATFAVFLGVYYALAAWVAMANLQLPWFSQEMFSMLVSIYPGLAPTATGIVIGLVWGAFCGGICGAIIASLYNWTSKIWK